MTAAAYPLNVMCLRLEDYEDLEIHELKIWKYKIFHLIATPIFKILLHKYTVVALFAHPL